jgi:MerR family transcriptional regulator, light-induced transcriptional regulator
MADSSSTQPATFTIGEVVASIAKLFPDLSHSGLRFLEREGLLTPLRTEGGHRLYRQSDMDRIVSIKSWREDGVSIDEIRRRLAKLDSLPSMDQLSDVFLDLAIAGNLREAGNQILTADEAGVAPLVIFNDVLTPALIEVGRRWEIGILPVAQEKEISEVVRDLVAEIARRHITEQSDGPAIVAGCVEYERHELGLRMICALLRIHGYRVYYLGADVSPEFLLQAIALHRPKVLLLSAMLPTALEALERTIEQVRAATSGIDVLEIVVGGSLVTHEHEKVSSMGTIPMREPHLAASLATIQRLAPH